MSEFKPFNYADAVNAGQRNALNAMTMREGVRKEQGRNMLSEIAKRGLTGREATNFAIKAGRPDVAQTLQTQAAEKGKRRAEFAKRNEWGVNDKASWIAYNNKAFAEGHMTESERDQSINTDWKTGRKNLDRMMGREVKEKKTPFGKINPSQYTQSSVQKFATSGKYGDLVKSVDVTDTVSDKLTRSQRGDAKNIFINKKIQSRKFVKLSNRVMDSIAKDASQLGVVGAIARLGDEVKSISKNIGSEFGIDVSGVSNNAGDYEFGSLASKSAAFKTNALSLALIFASASGLGEGRALTNKDVQRALDAIGTSTNSPEQLFSRMKTIQQNLQDSLQIEADERGYEFKGIPEMKATEGATDEAVQIRDDFRSGKITREQAREKLQGLGG